MVWGAAQGGASIAGMSKEGEGDSEEMDDADEGESIGSSEGTWT